MSKQLVALFIFIYIISSDGLLSLNKQKLQTVPDIIRSNGYSAESHKVLTDDGYILELHRILPKRRKADGTSPVVFMHHCLLCSSYEFVINTPNTSLGYILADNGYDVWLANSRGNYYSRNHKTLSPNQREFWNFSMDEISLKDLPAGIDHALKVAGQKKLYYIGYSMGGAVILSLLSERIEYNDKIKFMILVAPATYVEHNRGPLLKLTSGILIKFFRMLGINEILPGNLLFDALTSFFCSEPIGPVCEATLEQMTGLKSKYITRGLLPTIISHTPAGTSLKTIVQFTQAASSGEFKKFDYGRSENVKMYGSESPPKYVLENINTPAAVISSEDDWLASPKDIQRGIDELPRVVFQKKIVGKQFSHLDFFWTERAESLVYRDIIQLLDKN